MGISMNALQLIRHGQQFLAEKNLHKAEEVSRAPMARQPDLPPIRYFACEVAIAKGDFAGALEHIERALEGDATAAQLHLMKADILLKIRKGIKAEESAKRAAELKPEDPVIQFQAALLLMRADKPKAAEPFFMAAQTLGAESPHFLFELAKNRYYCGDSKNASETIERFLKLAPQRGEALALQSKLKKQTPEANNVAMLRSVLTQKLAWQDEVGAAYALAKELEDLGEYDDAFEAMSRAASTQRKHLRYSVANETTNKIGRAHV